MSMFEEQENRKREDEALPEGIFSSIPPVQEDEPSVRERIKDLIAMCLAVYSILLKPLLCVLIGTLCAWLLVRAIMHW